MQPVDWALTREGLSAPKQLLLVALSWMADEDGVTFKGQPVIAERLGKDPRWVREHLPTLAAEGHISRLRRHLLNGARTTDLIVLNLPRDRPLDLSAYSGIVGDLEDGDAEPTGGFSPGGLPAKSRQPTGGFPPVLNSPLDNQGDNRRGTGGRARAPVDPADDPRMQIPEGFPEHLRPHAREVMRILKAVAEQHGAKKVWPQRVGVVIMHHPRHPLVKAAHALASWAVDPPRPIKDVVSTYETFLNRETELAATERLAEDGTVATTPAGTPAGVTPIHGHSRAARKAAQDAEWEAYRAEITSGGDGTVIDGTATDA
jgi:hypothetical protein